MNEEIIKAIEPYVNRPDSWVHKFGYHGTLAGATASDIWALGAVANADVWYVAAGGVLTVVSSNAGDTGTIKVRGILVSGAESIATVTMNGTTPVVVPGIWKAVFRAGYDSGILITEPLGTITALIGAVVVATILPGDGQTLQAFYIVPSGCTGYLIDAYCECGKLDEMAVRVMVANPGESWKVKHLFQIYSGNDSKKWADQSNPKEGGLVLTAGTLIKMTAVPSAGTKCSAGFDIALYVND